MESQYLIIDDDNKSHVEIFYPKNNKINILPKSNLNGDFQNYLPLLHTPDKFPLGRKLENESFSKIFY